MKKLSPVTSGQRAVICKLYDLAIDVTLAGKYVADADYHGTNHLVTVCTYPAGSDVTHEKGVMLSCFMNQHGDTDEKHVERVNHELAGMLDHLTAKLEENAQ